MRHLRSIAVVGIIGLSAGCYHATINTGRPASGQQVTNNWAHGFLYGLVPPATVETAAQCPNGVATVETQHSSVNLIAQAITFGIYSPMTIVVTCAASSPTPDSEASMTVPAGASMIDLANALNAAAQQAIAQNAPVLVDFRGLTP